MFSSFFFSCSPIFQFFNLVISIDLLSGIARAPVCRHDRIVCVWQLLFCGDDNGDGVVVQRRRLNAFYVRLIWNVFAFTFCECPLIYGCWCCCYWWRAITSLSHSFIWFSHLNEITISAGNEKGENGKRRKFKLVLLWWIRFLSVLEMFAVYLVQNSIFVLRAIPTSNQFTKNFSLLIIWLTCAIITNLVCWLSTIPLPFHRKWIGERKFQTLWAMQHIKSYRNFVLRINIYYIQTHDQ